MGKYDKYVLKEPKGLVVNQENQKLPSFALQGENFNGLKFNMGVSCIDHPWFMDEKPMKHDFDQILCFIGGDPLNMFDFKAKVELFLGEEGEKHIINQATLVYVPKGLIHCPINFKIIESPIIFMDISLTENYSRNVKDESGWTEKLTLMDLAKMNLNNNSK